MRANVLTGLASERVKMKRTWLVWLAVIAPVGIFAMNWFNFALRYEWLFPPEKDVWDVLIRNFHMLSSLALPFGATLLTAMIAGMEHQADAWKQMLALPVSRTRIFFSKWLWVAGLLLLSSLLLIAAMRVLGWKFGFAVEDGWRQVIGEGMYPYFATLPLISIQLWLSCTMKNQAIPFTIGLVGGLFAPPLSSPVTGMWVPYAYPSMAFPSPDNLSDPVQMALLGLCVGLVTLVVCAQDFARRDVQ